VIVAQWKLAEESEPRTNHSYEDREEKPRPRQVRAACLKMKSWTTVLWVPMLLAALMLTNCARFSKPRQSSAMERCLAEFRSIPRVDAVMQSRSRGDGSAEDSQPFKGMEIALTLNGAILSTADPDANADEVCYKQNNTENFRKLLDTLRQRNIPPTVDFVNGNHFELDLAAAWLASGNLLGNLTYDNGKAVQLGADEFVSDISRADERLAEVWRQHPQTVRYFRYPARKVAKSERSRETIEQYLARAGYTTAPYTIESLDDSLAEIYCRALDSGDSSCANLVKLTYYTVLMDTTERARAAARELAGRDARQILVLYMNQLTCDTLGQTLDWYTRLGARFISLDEALSDPFFKMTTSDGSPMGITVVDMVRDEQSNLAQ